MDGMTEEGTTEPAGLSERPQEAGVDKSAGGPPGQRFSAKRKLRAVSRLLRGEPLELVARELNVTAARLSGMAGAGFAGRRGGAEGARARRPRQRDRAAEGKGRRDDHGGRAVAGEDCPPRGRRPFGTPEVEAMSQAV